MQLPNITTNRRGAALAETAIVLPLVLTLSLGMLDLAIGVFRYNTVSQAARQGARKAIVHGKLAPPQSTQWGPATYTASGNGTGAIETALLPDLAGLDPAQVTIRLEWLDLSSAPDSRVRVTVSTTYYPILTSLFGNPAFILTGSSTTRIAH